MKNLTRSSVNGLTLWLCWANNWLAKLNFWTLNFLCGCVTVNLDFRICCKLYYRLNEHDVTAVGPPHFPILCSGGVALFLTCTSLVGWDVCRSSVYDIDVWIALFATLVCGLHVLRHCCVDCVHVQWWLTTFPRRCHQWVENRMSNLLRQGWQFKRNCARFKKNICTN